MIQIYNDTGSSESCITHLVHELKRHSPNLAIKQVKGADVRSEKHLNPSSIICFPGGYDLGYLQSLDRTGCEIVRSHIQSGGRYLGLCAGAYFASDYCAFDVDGPLEVVGPRFIRLFKGKAVGPVYGGFEYNSEKGTHAVQIESCLSHMKPFQTVVYHNGGCTFESDDWADSRVLYRYTDTGKPAIIACRLGSGWGILSGVHFEYDSNMLRRQQAQSHLSDTVLNQLLKHEESRSELFHNLINCLLDPLFDLTKFGFSSH